MAEIESIRSPDIDAREVGRRLAQARYEAGWMTQETLAELLCVCKRSVQAYEAGRTIPYRHLPRLAEIFERSPSWFLYGDQPTEQNSSLGDLDGEIVKRLDAQTRALKALAVQMREMRSALNALSSRVTNSDNEFVS